METTFLLETSRDSIPKTIESAGVVTDVPLTRESVEVLRSLRRVLSHGEDGEPAIEKFDAGIRFAFGEEFVRYVVDPRDDDGDQVPDPGVADEYPNAVEADPGFSAMSLDRVRLRRDLDSVFNHGKCTRAEYDRYSGMIGVQRLSADDARGVQEFVAARESQIRPNGCADADREADETINQLFGRK